MSNNIASNDTFGDTTITEGALITSAISKVTPIDTDLISIVDSTASNILKNLTWANLKVTLKTYFDTLYPSYNGWNVVSDTWTYASADSPSFVITIPTDGTTKYSVGMRIKVTQTTVKYFIVTAVSATTLTVYGGTDYTLANTAITSIFFSTTKAPFGFPLQKSKWTVTFSDNIFRSQASPTTAAWYNLGSSLIVAPIGSWVASYRVAIDAVGTTSSYPMATLSTTNNSESNPLNTCAAYISATSATETFTTMYSGDIELNVISKTTYYLNGSSALAASSLSFQGNRSITLIKLVCAYL
jgi:hypothetical protein